MKCVLVFCKHKIVLTAFFFLPNLGVGFAMIHEELEHPVTCTTRQEAQVLNVENRLCCSSFRFPKWPIKWPLKHRRKKIIPQDIEDRLVSNVSSILTLEGGIAEAKRGLNDISTDREQPSVDKITIRILFVEDDAVIRHSIETAAKKYNRDSSKKYEIHYKFLTHGFLAVEYLNLPENIKPHIIVTDNNMESFYLGNKNNFIDRKAGCELGKLLRPQKVHADDSPSIYRYARVNEAIRRRYTHVKRGDEQCAYEQVDYHCTYSCEPSSLNIEPFEGLIFLSTSDSPAELGEKNIALFDGLSTKLKHAKLFSNFIRDNEAKINDVCCSY